MNDAQLAAFREIADTMLGPELRNWNWRGPTWGEFGITERRAATMKAKYGGTVWQQIPQADTDPTTGIEYGSLS